MLQISLPKYCFRQITDRYILTILLLLNAEFHLYFQPRHTSARKILDQDLGIETLTKMTYKSSDTQTTDKCAIIQTFVFL